ncbi:MAG: YceI family protein [Caldilineaceae bacterium]
MKTHRTIMLTITATLTAGLLAGCVWTASRRRRPLPRRRLGGSRRNAHGRNAVFAPTPDPTAASETEATAAGADTETAAALAPAEALDTASDRETETFVIVPEESEARYSINEVFISDNNALVTAIGRTTAITGSLTLNYADPAASTFDEFVVDVSLLRSDRSRRDRAIRSRWLESATFPLATFKVTEVRGFPADPAEGEPIDFQLVGDMTVKETTREVVWDVTAMLEGDRPTGSATLSTFLEDFNIPVPSIAGILRVLPTGSN